MNLILAFEIKEEEGQKTVTVRTTLVWFENLEITSLWPVRKPKSAFVLTMRIKTRQSFFLASFTRLWNQRAFGSAVRIPHCDRQNAISGIQESVI